MTDSPSFSEKCVVCGKPTTSHPIPRGWLCHTCLTEKDDEELLNEFPVAPTPDLTTDSVIECYHCGHSHTFREAHTPGSNHIAIAVGVLPFGEIDTLIIVSCPSCTHVTEYPTIRLAGVSLGSKLGIKVRKELKR